MLFGFFGMQALRQSQMHKKFISGKLDQNKSRRKKNWAEAASEWDAVLSFNQPGGDLLVKACPSGESFPGVK